MTSQMGGMAAGFELNEGMMKMMGGFTVIGLASMMGTVNIKISKEQLLALNAQLNQIPKPEKKGVFGFLKK